MDSSDAASSTSYENFGGYMRFWAGQQVSIIGSAVVMFALDWFIAAEFIQDNNSLLSLVFFVSFLPFVLFSPIAGVVADKFDRRMIIIISDSIQAGLSLLLIIFFWIFDLQLWHFLVINALRATCQAFHQPVGFTLVSIFVPKEKVTKLNGLNFLMQSAINIIAAPIGAFLLTALHIKHILWLDVITFAIAIIPLLKLKFPKRKNTKSNDDLAIRIEGEEIDHSDQNSYSKSKKSNFFSSLKESYHTIKAIPGLINTLIMATFLNFFFQPFDTLMINFIKYFHGGSQIELSILIVVVRIGMLIGGIWVSIKKQWNNWVLAIGGGIFLMGVGLIAMGLVPEGWFWLLYVVGFFLMILNPIVNSLFQSILQLKINPDQLGRVISIVITLSSIMSPIGMLISGPIADALGSIPMVYVGSGVMSVLMFLLLGLNPKVLNLLREGQKLANNQIEEEPQASS